MAAEQDEASADEERDPHRVAAAERAALKRAVKRLGWVLVDADSVEVRVERAVTIGPRTIVIRGRVPIDMPPELTVASRSVPPDRTESAPPDETVALMSVPPEKTPAKPPLAMTVSLAVPPESANPPGLLPKPTDCTVVETASPPDKRISWPPLIT